jgi:hypothetical protein
MMHSRMWNINYMHGSMRFWWLMFPPYLFVNVFLESSQQEPWPKCPSTIMVIISHVPPELTTKNVLPKATPSLNNVAT